MLSSNINNDNVNPDRFCVNNEIDIGTMVKLKKKK